MYLTTFPLLGIIMATLTSSAIGRRLDNIEYGRASDAPLLMDAHIPDGAGPFPAAIIVHGGAWVRGDRKHTVQPLFAPLTNAGFAWFSISYRLANDLHGGITAENGVTSALALGAAVDDVRQAVAYVKAHAAEYHVDPHRIALIGESAGAQLASMAALKPNANGHVQAVVAMYSPSDLVSLAETSPQIPEAVRQAFKGTPWAQMLIAGLRDLSPITWVSADAPPFLLIHGTSDTLIPFEQSQKMCAALRGAGGSCEVYAVKGGGHGLRWWEAVHLTAYKKKMIEWLDEELNSGAAADRAARKSSLGSFN